MTNLRQILDGIQYAFTKTCQFPIASQVYRLLHGMMILIYVINFEVLDIVIPFIKGDKLDIV